MDNGRIQYIGRGSTPERTLLQTLMRAAVLLETRMETVTFRDDAGFIDFVTEYVPLENLEWAAGNSICKKVRSTENMNILEISVDISGF